MWIEARQLDPPKEATLKVADTNCCGVELDARAEIEQKGSRNDPATPCRADCLNWPFREDPTAVGPGAVAHPDSRLLAPAQLSREPFRAMQGPEHA